MTDPTKPSVGYFVFADAVTHKIRAWYYGPQYLLGQQQVLESEAAYQVSRRPEFEHDQYVNPETGEMQRDPI